MRRHFLMYFAFALFTSLTQCSKTTVDPNGLPPETQTGAGTFACKINGVVWRYKDPNYEFLSTKPKTRLSFDPNYKGGYLEISAVRYEDGIHENELLGLVADSLLTKKTKTVNFTNYRDFFNYGLEFINYYALKSDCREYITTTALDSSAKYFCDARLNITKLDQTTHIISGTFYASIYQNSCGDTLKFTEGRFDLKYQ